MLALLISVAAAQGLTPCATPWLLPTRVHVDPIAPTAPPPATGKGLRTAYDDVPHLRSSENFALWWGDGVSLADSTADALLDAFEASWDVQIGVLGHQAPSGSDDWLFNVYVGSTGDGTPSDYGAAGYYFTDREGWPMVVINTTTARDPEDYGRAVVAHEFYHALQDQTGAYAYASRGAFTDGSWFWEATATWVVNEVFPQDVWHSTFLFGYLLVPERPLNDFTYPDGSLEGYHQYGAFLFPRFLTEHAVAADVIAQTWKDGTRTGDPLDVLTGHLEDAGLDLGTLFTEFAARNVLYDYAHGGVYQDVVDAYAPYFPGEDHRVAAEIRGDGDREWFQVDEDLAPGRFGYNLLRFEWPDDGDLVLEFDGDTTGRDGSEAAWSLAVVTQGDDGDELTLLDAADSPWRFEEVDGLETVTVVVAAIPDEAEQDERFDYRWRLEIVLPLPEVVAELDPGDGESPALAGCGCASAPASARGLAPLLLGVLIRRRRAGPARG